MCSRGHKKLYKVDLGRTAFKETWNIQKKLVELRHQSRIPDCLLLTEHEPVITMGRASSQKNILCSSEELKRRKIEVYEIERGGDVTFHGPGQLVAYPIIDLTQRGRDLHLYLRDLERLVIETLSDVGLKAEIKKGLTGVWVNNHKLAAIGVAVSRWISYHGLALNVNTDMDYFRLINPCGITEYPVGSISQMLGKEFALGEIADILANRLAEMFYYEMEEMADIDAIIQEGAAV